MALLADLDAALDSLGTALTDLTTKQNQAIADLEAKIANTPPGQSVDVSAEVNRVKGFTTAIAALGAAASAADPATAVPAAVPAPTAPATPPTP